MNRLASRRPPIAPLRAVDPAKIALRIRPLIPDGDSVFIQESDVRIPTDKPEQLVNNRLEMYSLSRDQGEAIGEIEPHLSTERGNCTHTGSVLFRFAFFEDQMEQFLVFFHSDSDQIRTPGRSASRI